jgi:hypothetical protein
MNAHFCLPINDHPPKEIAPKMNAFGQPFGQCLGHGGFT